MFIQFVQVQHQIIRCSVLRDYTKYTERKLGRSCGPHSLPRYLSPATHFTAHSSPVPITRSQSESGCRWWLMADGCWLCEVWGPSLGSIERTISYYSISMVKPRLVPNRNPPRWKTHTGMRQKWHGSMEFVINATCFVWFISSSQFNQFIYLINLKRMYAIFFNHLTTEVF